jgi:hypothetical protein
MIIVFKTQKIETTKKIPEDQKRPKQGFHIHIKKVMYYRELAQGAV